MSTIVAGRFERVIDANAALEALKGDGFTDAEVELFYVAPPGQHARHPLGGVKAVALLLGIWLIAAGVVRLIAAFALPGHRVWRICVALVFVIFGIVIVSSPHIGYATLALITGLGFICYGLGMLAVGWAMHTIRHEGLPVEPGMSAG